jgi:adenosine deaminase
LECFIQGLPKAEIHLHIEGTLEPNLMWHLAERNGIALAETTVEALNKAYSFQNLQNFLDLYYEGASVLLTEEDFYDLTLGYLDCAHQQNCKRVEFFFDPQAHTARGVSFESIMNGMNRAIKYAREAHDGMSIGIILCFLRHLSEEEAFETLEQARAFREDIIGVGLDSTELNNPPSKFERVFEKARGAGFHVVAHAGEEGSAQYIEDSLNLLKAERIDHGIKCLQDNVLVHRLIRDKIPLTTCPFSNVKLRVVKDMTEFPLVKLLEAGLLVTINSDDPAYFGGYLNDNYLAVAQTFDLSRDDLRLLAKNSFQATFASDEEKKRWIEMVDEYCDNFESI